MTGGALVLPVSSKALAAQNGLGNGPPWVTLERADFTRLESHVSTVAATDASVTIAGLMVPLDRVLAVHLPSRLGDSTVRADERWRGRARRRTRPGQEELL